MPELKLRLHDLAEGLRAIGERVEESGGELTPELEAELDALGLPFESKAEGVAALVVEMEGKAEFVRGEADRLRARADSFEKAAKRLKGYLHGSFVAAGYARLKSARFTIWRQKSAASFGWDGEGAIPEGFRKVVIVLEGEDALAAREAGAFAHLNCRVDIMLDHAAARAAHKDGRLPRGFTAMQSEHLRIG